MTQTIGGVVIDFIANTAGFENDLAKVEKAASRTGRNAGQSLGGIGRGLDGAAGSIKNFAAGFFSLQGLVGGVVAGLGVSSLVDGLSRVLDVTGELVDTADRLGVTTDALQELRFAAGQSGVGADQLDTALTKLSTKLGEFASGGKEATDAFTKLGLASQLNSGELQTTDQVLEAVAGKLSEFSTTAEASAAAADLFGDRLGPKLVGFLRTGQDGIRSLREDARNLGIVMSSELVAQSEAAGDKLAALGNVISSTVTVAIAQLTPKIGEIAQSFLDSLPAIQRWINETFEGVGRVIEGFRVLDTAIKSLDIGAALGSLNDALGGAFEVREGSIADQVFKLIGAGATDAADKVKQLDSQLQIMDERIANAREGGGVQLAVELQTERDKLQAEMDRLQREVTATSTPLMLDVVPNVVAVPTAKPAPPIVAAPKPAPFRQQRKPDTDLAREREAILATDDAYGRLQKRLKEIDDAAKRGVINRGEAAEAKGRAQAEYTESLKETRAALGTSNQALDSYQKKLADIDETQKKLAGTPFAISNDEATRLKAEAHDEYVESLKRTKAEALDTTSAFTRYQAALEKISTAQRELAGTELALGAADLAAARAKALDDYTASLEQQRATVLGTSAAYAEYRDRVRELDAIRRQIGQDPNLGITEAQVALAGADALAAYNRELQAIRSSALSGSTAAQALADKLAEIARAERELAGTGAAISEGEALAARQRANQEYEAALLSQRDQVLELDIAYGQLHAQLLAIDQAQRDGAISAAEANRARGKLQNPTLGDVFTSRQDQFGSKLDQETAQNPLAGATAALGDYYADATRYGAIAGDAIATGLDGATKAMTQFVLTGKSGFKELLASMVEYFTELAIQQAIVGLIGAAFGGPTTAAVGAYGNAQPNSQSKRGFATGGSFMVAGRAGRDTNLVQFMATQGERVTIDRPGGDPMSGDGPLHGYARGGSFMVGGKPSREREMADANVAAVSAPATTFVINDQRGASAPEIERREKTGPGGSREIELFIGREVQRQIGTGKTDRVMGQRYGLKPQPR